MPPVRGSGSDDLTSGVAHSHVGLAIASSPTTRATAYVELGACDLGGAVVFSPIRLSWRSPGDFGFLTSMCLLTCTAAANKTPLRRRAPRRPVHAVVRPFGAIRDR